ncbi:MAG TPA: tRNA pseudouridine(13) synthase TruD [Methanocorpusculum sp.]|nr:tRNA pseudouridine(13) synthase TruD [Methanocorpusculum sp.]
MKKSGYQLEQTLGMGWYASDSDGIGGHLRESPEDFIVEEIPESFTGQGPYAVVKLVKKSWEHQHAMREITNRLRISPKRIGWAGTKDRNAVTTQYLTLYNVTPEEIAALNIKDMELSYVGQHQSGLSLGQLQGNRFTLTLRGCSKTEGLEEICRAVAEGIPNYYGLQRFGSLKPVTHRMGYHILRGEYEDAVRLYVGDAFPYESDDIKAARRSFAETLDAKQALNSLPVHLSYERIMLDSLMKKKEDYGSALQALPPKLLSMFVSAYQSWLFNLAVSARLQSGTPFGEPRIGEHLIFANGRVDTVTEKNIPVARQHMKRNRCFIVGWMPGKTLGATPGPLEEVMLAQMKSDGIAEEDFGHAAEFVQTAFDGNNRRISLSAEVDAKAEGPVVTLKFALPSGHYATTVAREFMKAAPEEMV